MSDLKELQAETKKVYTQLCKYGYTMANKHKENVKLARAIQEYFYQELNITLPYSKKDYSATLEKIWDYDLYGTDFQEKYEPLAKAFYELRQCIGLFKKFPNPDNPQEYKLCPTSFLYSKHRICHIWNWRKSSLIRNAYFKFLKEAKDEKGRLLWTHYRPIHLVLTVPHATGTYKEKQFYVKELLEDFLKLRRQKFFKKAIYGGEYGVETTTTYHGNHSHLHIFLLQHPEYKVNDVRQYVAAAWKEITGNTAKYSGVHYETLYTWKKNEKGEIITYEDERNPGKKRPIKDYIIPGQSTLDQYLSGVMECVKYHFSPDSLKAKDGSFDLPLINTMLYNTAGKRLYSRFGNFYKRPELNFNKLWKKEEGAEEVTTEQIVEETINESEETGEEVKADFSKVQNRIPNPYTLELEAYDGMNVFIGNPATLRYCTKDSDIPYEPFLFTDSEFRSTPPGLTLGELIKWIKTGKAISSNHILSTA